jgi:hypothetical protein
VSRDGVCARSSTECANGSVAGDGAGALNSTGRNAEEGGVGHSGLCVPKKRGSDNQHACRLHVIRDVRKSVFTLKIRVFRGEGS